MRATIVLTAIAAGLVSASEAHAQQRLTLDLRANVSAPVEKFSGGELGTGLGFGFTGAVRVQPHLHVYAGWDWLHFNPETSFAGADLDFEETGYVFGLRFDHPLGSTPTLRIEAGGTFKHVEIESNTGEVLTDSKHKLGVEFGGGITVPLAGSWRIAPMVRYRSLEPEFVVDDATTGARLRYVAFELGVSKRF